ncbi:type I-C CRISPR-associated protein Cas8c/Csd1 [Schinkia azotoformans]|uniref:type I-C CRISPR-associated protein Cas8c/Csd1 n=1 Tax=Schinkia azotoformans TaxID=1454 RepID=UPI002DBB276F|nr:type I-C CRISPR-associated protein Cas8c/Csd1 [Schinkia azotoformans]MEC1719999.1 type I-C CRISPR-associated protein Cas8c/Csd1 [Schinkia azotoformans]MED4415669.1 type I-C CRISPR-associated protein Cas8c/Csd1 [Schinkia azotoformans]
MILQSLVNYYQMLINQNDSHIPKLGYSEENVHFCLMLDEDGNLKSVRDLRDNSDNKKSSKLVPIKLTLPERVQKSSGIRSNCFWENAEYALGVEKKKDKGKVDKKVMTQKRFQFFCNLHESILKNTSDAGATALLLFLDKHKKNNCQNELIAKIEDDLNNGELLVFRLEGDSQYLHERPAIKKVWENYYSQKEGNVKGISLISGKEGSISENHATISGVKDAQSAGARIVSFNAKAFESYGHEKGYISPITEEEMFQYTTVLNYLLSRKGQRIQIADATTVFWSETNNVDQTNAIYALLTGGDIENELAESEEKKENEHDTMLIHSFLKGIQKGNPIDWDHTNIDRNTEFYILGLSPNNARISIRYFYKKSFGDTVQNIARHYKDTELYSKNNYAPLIPWRMLSETAVNDKVHPLLGGTLLKTLLNGTRYPNMFYQQILLRIRAEQSINHYKAASIKGYLVRKARFENNIVRERLITVSLNEDREDFAYLFGRLFAVLESTQLAANPGIERTLRTTYFSRASSTPKVVFSTLLRLNQYHQDKLAKEMKGLQVNHDKLITQILEKIATVPPQLNLEEQGDFMLGYYQQKQELYRKGDRE